MKKRLVLLAIATLFIAGALVAPAQAHPSSFPDVSEANPAHNAIEYLASNSVITGLDNGTFDPNGTLKRAQAVKILVTWRGEKLSASSSHFSDVDATYQPYVETALAKAWLAGYPDGTFHPYGFVTREQMAILAVKSLGLGDQAVALTSSQVDSALRPFLDAVAVSPQARPFVALAVQRGLISGDNQRLNPLDAMTRAQFSILVFRAAGSLDPTLTGAAAPAATGPGTSSTGTEASSAGTNSPSLATDGSSTGAGSWVPTEPVDPQRQALAQFMDAKLFQPHNSAITGEMVLQNADWYGIPALTQLVIMAAETSLGDPSLGGTLARRNNFGCMRYHGADTVWGQLSDARIWVAGKDWYSFPTAQAGMEAFGRYLKSGVNGFYVPILSSGNPDWSRFAAVYYGSGVSGFSSYVSRLYAIQARFKAQAAASGVSF